MQAEIENALTVRCTTCGARPRQKCEVNSGLPRTDPHPARLLAAEKETFRTLEAEATDAHFNRLRAGRPDTVETSALHLDALRDLKNVNTHLVAAAAYPVLENMGELLRSRLRQESEIQE